MSPEPLEYGVTRSQQRARFLYFSLAQLPCALILFFGLAWCIFIFFELEGLMGSLAPLVNDKGVVFSSWERSTFRDGHACEMRKGELAHGLYMIHFTQLRTKPGDPIETDAQTRLRFGAARPVAIGVAIVLIVVVRIWMVLVRRWLGIKFDN